MTFSPLITYSIKRIITHRKRPMFCLAGKIQMCIPFLTVSPLYLYLSSVSSPTVLAYITSHQSQTTIAGAMRWSSGSALGGTHGLVGLGCNRSVQPVNLIRRVAEEPH